MPGFLYDRDFLLVLKEMLTYIPESESGLIDDLKSEINLAITKSMLGLKPDRQNWINVFKILEKHLPEDNLQPWQMQVVNTYGGHDYFND